MVIGLDLDRKLLHERQNKRVDLMIEEGLEEEVRSIYQKEGFLDGTASKAIGYKEFYPYFEGKITLDEVIESIKIHTHQYAKRQFTWFRNQMNVSWVKADIDNFENTINEAKSLVDKWIK